MPQSHEIVYEKLVVVTRQTDLQGLIERFSTRDRARFYIEHMNASFARYETANDAQMRAMETLKAAIPDGVRVQYVDREFLPNFSFGPKDCAVTLGPDGLVINVAKYLDGQPLVAFNPDPHLIDGVLVPFHIDQAAFVLQNVVQGNFAARIVSMAKAQLNDGQVLYAVNDFFIGRRSHVSARYAITLNKQSENQSSSGIIVSTGAGSTGWLKSVVMGAQKIASAYKLEIAPETSEEKIRFAWESGVLVFCVREPFVSKTSSAQLVHGRIEAGQTLEILSQMPQDGVIFSDGIEDDYLEFNSGAIAHIGLAEKKLHLVVSPFR